jgi:hypothetical protein
MQQRSGRRPSQQQQLQELDDELVGMISSWLADASVVKYQYADIRGGEVLQSVAYTRAISRVSYNVLTTYTVDRQQAGSRALVAKSINYIAKVQYFVKVSAPSGYECAPLRLAIADLFEVQQVPTAAGIMYHSPCYDKQPSHKSYAVSFEQNCMQDKHVVAVAGDEAWFMPYKNMSGSGRAD